MLLSILRTLFFLCASAVLFCGADFANQANMAASYYENGDFAKSQALLTDVLRSASEGTTASERAIASNALALTLREQGRPKEAEQIYIQALATPGGSVESHALLEYDYGRLCLELGRTEQAERLASDAVRIRRASPLVTREQRAEAENLLGMVYYSSSRLDQAKAMFETALAEGEHSSAAAESFVNLGTLARHAGNLREAKEYFDRAVETARPMTTKREILATALNDLGLVAQDAGDLKGAEQMLRESLEAWQAPAGAKRLGYSGTVSNLGVVQERRHHYQEARALYEQALQMDKDSYGAASSTVGMDEVRLGSLLCHTGNEASGRALLEQAAEQQEGNGTASAVAAMAKGDLGLLAFRHKDWAEAERYLRDSIAELKQTTTATDTRRTAYLAAYAATLQHSGQFAEAEQTSAELAKVQYNFALHK